MVLTGKSIYEGIAIGRIAVFHRVDKLIQRKNISNAQEEIERLDEAILITKNQLEDLYKRASVQSGEEIASIFKIHQLFLEDQRVLKPIQSMIQKLGVNAEYAVAAVGDKLTEEFLEMSDNYMKERAADLRDVGRRVEAVLTGIDDHIDNIDEPVIIFADHLSPSETVLFDSSQVLAFVISSDSTDTHSAILAKTMEIPAMAGVKYSHEDDGKLAIVDSRKGIVIIDPDEETLESYRRQS